MPALEATLLGLGIDLRRQENVHLDVEARPTKSPRAFCAPIEVPGRVMLVIQPMGGPDDWHASSRGGAHRALRAHHGRPPRRGQASRRQRRHRGVGDGARAHRQRAGGLRGGSRFRPPEEFAAEAAAGLLYFVRRYAAKFLYELELHDGSALEDMDVRYVERMQDALKIELSAVDYLADVDPGFYSSSYLRAWAFESLLRGFLREEFGRAGSRGPRRARSCASSGARGSVHGRRAHRRGHGRHARSRGGRRAHRRGCARMRKVVIAGAAGRDFHNFNLVFRGNDDVHVVAFTATQIPDIEGRVYPPELAGPRLSGGHPDRRGGGSRRAREDGGGRRGRLRLLRRDARARHAPRLDGLAAGADYVLLGPRSTELRPRSRSSPSARCGPAPGRARRPATSPPSCAAPANASPSCATRCPTAT